MAAAWEDVSIEQRNDVGIVWFERPHRLNAFRLITFQMLREVLDQLAQDPAVRAVVITGRGRGFCAGEDLDEMGQGAAGGFSVRGARRDLVRLQDLTRRILAFPARAQGGPSGYLDTTS